MVKKVLVPKGNLGRMLEQEGTTKFTGRRDEEKER